MPLQPDNTNISTQLNWIKTMLKDWAKDQGGVAIIGHDLNHLWEIAFSTSKVPRCIIAYVGEDIRGDFSWAAAASRVDRHFIVLVTRARGYTADRGQTFSETVGTSRPFVDLLEEARDIIRTLTFDPATTEANSLDPVDYRGIKPALPDDYPLDAYQIEFSIGTQLGIPYDQNSPTGSI